MARGIAEAALGAKGDLDKLGKAKFPGGKDSVADTIKEMIGTIGENMTLRRTAYLDVKKGAVASYIHNRWRRGSARSASSSRSNSTGDAEQLKSFGRRSPCTSPPPIRKPSTSRASTRR